MRNCLPAFGVAVLVLTTASVALGGTGQQDVESYLRAYVFQHEKWIDEEVATAAYIAHDVRNGLTSISNMDPEIASLVLDVLRSDQAKHLTEYQARKHIANSESLGPSIPWNLERVQKHLWDMFLGDPRWVGRIMPEIRREAEMRGIDVNVSVSVDAVAEASLLLRTDIEQVERVIEKLTAHRTPEGPSCGANPIFAMRKAKRCDPMLVAAVFDARTADGLLPGLRQVVEFLGARGWVVQSGQPTPAVALEPVSAEGASGVSRPVSAIAQDTDVTPSRE